MTDRPRPDERWSDEREIRISSDPASVWAAWAEPEHVRRWFSDDAHGRLEEGASLVHEFEGHGEQRYSVMEVDAPSRLVLEGELDGRAFRQEVELRRGPSSGSSTRASAPPIPTRRSSRGSTPAGPWRWPS